MKKLMEKFTKTDLKNGQLVELRNGTLAIITNLYDGKLVGICDDDHFLDIHTLTNDDLTNRHIKTCDIVKIYSRPSSGVNCIIPRIFDPRYRELLWERKGVQEMTLAEVCEALGYEVKIVKEN